MSNEYDRWLNYEIMVSAMVATGMARKGNPNLQPTDTYASVQFPGPNPCETLGGACPLYSWNSQGAFLPTQSEINSPTNFRMTVPTTVSGLGYDLENVPIKIALAVLSLYIILALSHITYLLRTGASSPSWDTFAEVTMLAWNSERTESLRHTSACVQMLHVFQQPVSVKATGNDGLALVLEGDGYLVERYGRVEKDHAY